MKKCCRCRVEKPLESFVKNKTSKDGHKGYCLDCHRQRTQEWRDNNQKKNQDAQRIYYWKTKAKQLEAQIKESGLYGIEGLSTIEDGLKNL